MAMPTAPSAPRTFPGDPNPPVSAPESRGRPAAAPGPESSAGSGALPPAAQAGAPGAPTGLSPKSYSVVERPDGSRDLFVSDKDGDTRMGAVDTPDADKVLHAVGRYDEASKTWDNIPEDVAKSLTSGRLGFPDRIINAWNGGEVGVVRSLLGAQVMNGEATGADAKEKADPLLLKVRLDNAPAVAWHGLGPTVAEMVKHPVQTAENAAVGAVGMLPMMKDILLRGTAPGAAKGILAGGAAVGAASVSGPLAPATVSAAVVGAMEVGAQYGTFKRAMDLMGGQFAIDMVDKGYDDKTVQKYAPLVGAVDSALTLMQFDLMTPAMQSKALSSVLGSDAVKGVMASWVAKYAGRTAAFGTLGTAQEAVNLFAGNMAAVAAQKPELLVAGPEAKKRLLDAALQMTLTGAVLGAPGAAMEGLAGKKAQAPAAQADALVKGYQEGKVTPEELLAGTKPEEKPAAKGEFVKNEPFEVKPKEGDRATATDIRETFAGLKNEQIVRGNQFADELRKAVPDPEERQGMFWYKAAEGDKAVLEDALRDPEMEKYHGQIKAALDLGPEALKQLERVSQYYEEAGKVSEEVGTIKSVLENYQNRIYEPEKEQDFVKSETTAGLKQTTRHAKQRVFDTEFDAARAGKTFATTDVADALSIHNEEMARVNTARKMADAMSDAGLGAWKRVDNIPDGWAQVGELRKDAPIRNQAGEAVIGEDGNQVVSRSVFAAPEGVAKGLAAIADPNFTRKIDALRGIQRFQGLVKTVDLSFSLFHHFSMLMQTVYQRDISSLMKMGSMDEFLGSPEFGEVEQDFARHGGITAQVQANQDILRHRTENTGDDTFSKVVNAPGVKQILEAADKNSNFLFGKVQRLLKANNYGTLVANWVADHPEATNAEVLAAKRGFAKHVNAVYGGLNWEAMGMTKSNLSLLRIGLLAPDWTISNLALLKQAVGEGGTAGAASRAHVLSALVVGMTLTEGLNHLLTGHFTDDNKAGHKLEVEIAPEVYVSLLRGGIGDITKFASMVAESGLGGVTRFAQGKLAPIPRTVAGLATNTTYTGGPIVPKNAGPVAGTYDVLKYALGSAGPVPLGVTNLMQYATKGKEPNVAGAAAVGSGLGRYSKNRKGK